MTDREPKILVIRFSSLGDIILMVPLIQLLRDEFPSGRIDLATKDEYAGLFRGSRLLDNIYTLNTGSLSELMRMRRTLAGVGYHIIIDAHNVIRSNILYRTIPAGRKAQLRKEQIRKFLLIKFNLNLFDETTEQYDKYMKLADELGIPARKSLPPFQLPPEAEQKARNLMERFGKPGGGTIALAPGAGWETKMWGVDKFISAADKLSELGYSLILTGGAAEGELAERIASSVKGEIINTAGDLNILETAAVLRISDLLITNDSALLHLSELAGTPVVALFGPTVREFGFYPRLEGSRVIEKDLECRPCSRNGAKPCPYSEKSCLDSIDPGEVVAAALSLLGRERAGISESKRADQ
ncbi:MAG: glycosyltransferase family 9 protein [Candidatus Krumholzibacteriales bacterium]